MGPVHERLAPKVDSTHKCPPAVWVDGVHKQISAMTQMPIYYQRETSQSYLSRKSVSGPDEKYCHVGLHGRWLSFALDAWSKYKSRYSSQFCQCIQNDMSNCQRLDMKSSNLSEDQTKLQYIDSLVHLIPSYCPMILVPTDLVHSCTISLCCFDGEIQMIQMIQTEVEIWVTRINELGYQLLHTDLQTKLLSIDSLEHLINSYCNILLAVDLNTLLLSPSGDLGIGLV